MSLSDEETLRAIWNGQAVTPLRMTPDQLRVRAAEFESTLRRRNLRDQICFALVAVFCAAGMLLDGVLVRVGSALMLGWALFSMYTLHRYGSTATVPAEISAENCAAHHQRQLERQRDIVLSWPWGIGMALPGFVLLAVGLGVESRHPNWMFAVVMIALMLFLYVALVIYGKMLAASWQREIDSLRALRGQEE